MDCDPWDWQDDGLKLDGAYPLEMIKCFWDEMPLGEDVSKTLLSTPLADIVPQDQPLFSIRDHQDPQASSTPAVIGSAFTGAFQGGSPRIKRRRLLFREAESTFDSREESTNDLEYLKECVPDVQGSMEHQGLQAADAFWYRGCDDSADSFGDVVDGVSHRWMAKCLEDGESSNKTHDEMKIDLPGGESSSFGGVLAAGEEDALGPTTPLPGRTTTNVSKPIEQRNQQSPPSTPNGLKMVATPVAYPFTLLKPEGGLTLREINEKLMLPPSRPVPHVQADDSWPTSPSELGLGLSGKSVITRTRIHTMGNGTITIMRTRD